MTLEFGALIGIAIGCAYFLLVGLVVIRCTRKERLSKQICDRAPSSDWNGWFGSEGVSEDFMRERQQYMNRNRDEL